MEAVNVNSLTAAGFPTEPDATDELDRLLSRYPEYFRVHPEVFGVYVQPKLDSQRSTCKIDRVVIPTQALAEAGWNHGPFGIECKRSGKKIGPVIAQCQDYKRAVFTLPRGFRVMLEWVFVWPLDKQLGDIASVMAQHRIGCARRSFKGGIEFLTDSSRLITADRDGLFARSTSVGRKAGSR